MSVMSVKMVNHISIFRNEDFYQDGTSSLNTRKCRNPTLWPAGLYCTLFQGGTMPGACPSVPMC